jgi:hypothetical protein
VLDRPTTEITIPDKSIEKSRKSFDDSHKKESKDSKNYGIAKLYGIRGHSIGKPFNIKARKSSDFSVINESVENEDFLTEPNLKSNLRKREPASPFKRAMNRVDLMRQANHPSNSSDHS